MKQVNKKNMGWFSKKEIVTRVGGAVDPIANSTQIMRVIIDKQSNKIQKQTQEILDLKERLKSYEEVKTTQLAEQKLLSYENWILEQENLGKSVADYEKYRYGVLISNGELF